LKIDVSFVRNMHARDTLRLVKAIVALGHSLSITLMAEGVETETQLEQLRNLGCEKAQGYLFGAAVSAEDTQSYRRSATSISGEEEPA
jgi:EAL domain-containing protein (putative c-di-GMP-specific phosphodiesterase class I)